MIIRYPGQGPSNGFMSLGSLYTFFPNGHFFNRRSENPPPTRWRSQLWNIQPHIDTNTYRNRYRLKNLVNVFLLDSSCIIFLWSVCPKDGCFASYSYLTDPVGSQIEMNHFDRLIKWSYLESGSCGILAQLFIGCDEMTTASVHISFYLGFKIICLL